MGRQKIISWTAFEDVLPSCLLLMQKSQRRGGHMELNIYLNQRIQVSCQCSCLDSSNTNMNCDIVRKLRPFIFRLYACNSSARDFEEMLVIKTVVSLGTS